MTASFVIFLILFHSAISVDLSSDVTYLENAEMSNLARGKLIEVNATCGEGLPDGEQYCRLVNHVRGVSQGETHCKTCRENDHSSYLAIDSNEQTTWWQSPSLARGSKYHYVTMTLDLKQVYRISYIIIKSAYSPLPGNWILERSIDNTTYHPWMYFVLDAKFCLEAYNMDHVDHRTYKFVRDDEVICTSAYDKASDGKIETAEMAVRLFKNRPGSEPQMPGESASSIISRTKVLAEFTTARYVRFRFQKIATFYGDKMIAASGSDYGKIEADTTTLNRLYYSIKDIQIGGSCICFGHSNRCPWYKQERKVKCQCQHNTEGDSCERCQPMYNQELWRPGKPCVRCQCYGKAQSCIFNQTVADQSLSQDTNGRYIGGGVCQDCQANTTGVNCEKCLPGYYRVASPYHPEPCRPCNCDHETTELCYQESVPDLNIVAGVCKCRQGFTGLNCAACALGYQRVAGQCVPCPCSLSGSDTSAYSCNPPCNCKTNVEPLGLCQACKRGFYNLQASNPAGCRPCFCFGLSTDCRSARGTVLHRALSDGWSIVSVDSRRSYRPQMEKTYPEILHTYLTIAWKDLTESEHYFWLAPDSYLKGLETAYGSEILLIFDYVDDSTSPIPLADHQPMLQISGQSPDGRSERLMFFVDLKRMHRDGQPNLVRVPLVASNQSVGPAPENGHWLTEKNYKATESELRSRLLGAQSIRVLAKYSLRQRSAGLRQLQLSVLEPDPLAPDFGTGGRVENCTCPGPGYAGLSCQACLPGHRRVANRLMGGVCAKCECNGQSDACDPHTGACIGCANDTEGYQCERCQAGYYGNPGAGLPCRRCMCPGPVGQFSNSCRSDPQSGHVCENCADGHIGIHCERCRFGYYGDPQAGVPCRPCNCSGNSDPTVHDTCDALTGRCKACGFNSTGSNCQHCQPGFYGNAESRGCRPCECFTRGSLGRRCNSDTGQCSCLPNFVGLKCDSCRPGHGNVSSACPACKCRPEGTAERLCNNRTGECRCLPGVAGPHCRDCQAGHYGLVPGLGCFPCGCGVNNSLPCNQATGDCICGPRQTGPRCDQCLAGHYWNANRTNCLPCRCTGIGSAGLDECDPLTGQCRCAVGVGGRVCDECLDNYWGLTAAGCTKCSTCFDGKRCDKRTGQCNCPPNTRGRSCEACTPGHWDFDAVRGCKPCGCHLAGSTSAECDPRTGACVCRPGFEGTRCDQCQRGYYGFPGCRRCDCNREGVLESMRDTCTNNGSCHCKPNTAGAQCLSCKAGSYARLPGYSQGCISCYCSVTNVPCRSDPDWHKTVALRRKFTLSVDPQPREYGVPADSVAEDHIIRGALGYVDIPLRYFQTVVNGSETELGDLMHEFGSDVAILNVSCSPTCGSLDSRASLISMRSDTEVKLAYSRDPSRDLDVAEAGAKITLTEDHWLKGGRSLTRMWLMYFLKSVVGLRVYLFNATASPVFSASVSLTVFVNKKIADPKLIDSLGSVDSVEQCSCTHPYADLSCQGYKPGFFTKEPEWNVSGNYINLLPPKEKILPCPCNGYSNECSLNGTCFNCRQNTTGVNCERCLLGYYRQDVNNIRSPCLACACPSQRNNYADECLRPTTDSLLCLGCRNNTDGNQCEKCQANYYGDPAAGVPCRPCNCNAGGVVPGSTCNSTTGECRCLPGIGGRACDACKPYHVVREGRCVTCMDSCTGPLIGRVNQLAALLDKVKDIATKLPLAQIGRIGQLEARLNDTEVAVDLLAPGRFNDLRDGVNRMVLLCLEALNQSFQLDRQADELEQLAGTGLGTTRAILAELDETGRDARNQVSSIQGKIRAMETNDRLADLRREAREIQARVLSMKRDRLEPFIEKAMNQLRDNSSARQLQQLRSILYGLDAALNMDGPFIRAYLERLIDLSRSILAPRFRIDAQFMSLNVNVDALSAMRDKNRKQMDAMRDSVNGIEKRLNDSRARLSIMNPLVLMDLSKTLQGLKDSLAMRSPTATLPESEERRLKQKADRIRLRLQTILERLKELGSQNVTEFVDPWAAIKQDIERLKDLPILARNSANNTLELMKQKLENVSLIEAASDRAAKEVEKLTDRLNRLKILSRDLLQRFRPRQTTKLERDAEDLRRRVRNATYDLPTVSDELQKRLEEKTNKTRRLIDATFAQFNELKSIRDSLNFSGPAKPISLSKVESLRRKLKIDLGHVRSLLHTVRGSLNQVRTPAPTIVKHPNTSQHCVRQIPLTVVKDQHLRTLSFRFQLYRLGDPKNTKNQLPKEILASVFNPLTKTSVILTAMCARGRLYKNDAQSNCNVGLYYGTGFDLNNVILSEQLLFNQNFGMWYEIALDFKTSTVTLNYLYDEQSKEQKQYHCLNRRQTITGLGQLIFTSESFLYQGGLPTGEKQLLDMFSDYRSGTLFLNELLVNKYPVSPYNYVNTEDTGCQAARKAKDFKDQLYPVVRQQTYRASCMQSFDHPITDSGKVRTYGFDGFSYIMISLHTPSQIQYTRFYVTVKKANLLSGQLTLLALFRVNEKNGTRTHMLVSDGKGATMYYKVNMNGSVAAVERHLLEEKITLTKRSTSLSLRIGSKTIVLMEVSSVQWVDLYVGWAPTYLIPKFDFGQLRGYRGCMDFVIPQPKDNSFIGASVGTVLTTSKSNCTAWVNALSRDAAFVAKKPIEVPADQMPDLEHWRSLRLRFSGGPASGGYSLFSLGNMLSLDVTPEGRLRLKSSPVSGIRRMRRMRRRMRRRLRRLRRLRLLRSRRSIEQISEGRQFILTGPIWDLRGRTLQVELKFYDALNSNRKVLMLLMDGQFIGGLYVIGKFAKLLWIGGPTSADSTKAKAPESLVQVHQFLVECRIAGKQNETNLLQLMEKLGAQSSKAAVPSFRFFGPRPPPQTSSRTLAESCETSAVRVFASAAALPDYRAAQPVRFVTGYVRALFTTGLDLRLLKLSSATGAGFVELLMTTRRSVRLNVDLGGSLGGRSVYAPVDLTDAEWHSFSLEKEQFARKPYEHLRLRLDDREFLFPVRLPNFTTVSFANWTGCLADIKINGASLDTKSVQASLGRKCPCQSRLLPVICVSAKDYEQKPVSSILSRPLLVSDSRKEYDEVALYLHYKVSEKDRSIYSSQHISLLRMQLRLNPSAAQADLDAMVYLEQDPNTSKDTVFVNISGPGLKSQTEPMEHDLKSSRRNKNFISIRLQKRFYEDAPYLYMLVENDKGFAKLNVLELKNSGKKEEPLGQASVHFVTSNWSSKREALFSGCLFDLKLVQLSDSRLVNSFEPDWRALDTVDNYGNLIYMPGKQFYTT